MKKNSTKKVIAILALLLIAIGAGVYFNHERTLNNGQNTASIPANTDSQSQAPVVTTAPVPTPATTDVQENAENKPVATTVSTKKRYHYRKFGKRTSAKNNDLDVSATAEYSGNIPATTQVTANVPDVNANNATTNKVVTREQTTTVAKSGNKKKPGRVNIAPEIGMNMNTLYHNNTSNIPTNGFNAGVMVNIGLNDVFAVQPGLRYIMKGNEAKSTGTEEETTNEVDIDSKRMLGYVEMPVNFVYKFGDKKGYSRFMIGAGPYISYLVNAQEKVNTTIKNNEAFVLNSQNTMSTSTDGLNKVDYGVGGFIGCQLPKGFYAKAGAEWGLSDVSRGQSGSKSSDRNNNYLISVGYILGPKGKIY